MQNSDKYRIYDALLVTLAFLFVCWALWLSEDLFGTGIKQYGMRPRELRGLIGILSMHFLHGDLSHISQNSLSFAILNGLLFFFYRGLSWKVFTRIMVFGGSLLWIWGRSSNHIGASLLIYGLAAFIFFSGIFRKDENMLRISLVVAFYYGSIIWWIFPIDPQISWEGHLSGAVVGITLAWLYRNEGPQRKRYQWEIDEEIEQERLKSLGNVPSNSMGWENINYEYIPKQAEENSDKEEDEK